MNGDIFVLMIHCRRDRRDGVKPALLPVFSSEHRVGGVECCAAECVIVCEPQCVFEVSGHDLRFVCGEDTAQPGMRK